MGEDALSGAGPGPAPLTALPIESTLSLVIPVCTTRSCYELCPLPPRRTRGTIATFETHDPRPTVRTGDEAVGGAAQDESREPSVDTDAPNPDREPVGDDGADGDDIEEPVEA